MKYVCEQVFINDGILYVNKFKKTNIFEVIYLCKIKDLINPRKANENKRYLIHQEKK